jgi:hypothetical protein
MHHLCADMFSVKHIFWHDKMCNYAFYVATTLGKVSAAIEGVGASNGKMQHKPPQSMPWEGCTRRQATHVCFLFETSGFGSA